MGKSQLNSFETLKSIGCFCTIIVNKKGLNGSQQINDVLHDFLDKVSLPELNENQTLKCEGVITDCELLKALTSMNNDKYP